VTEGQIAAVVEDFYAACRADPVLGPVFRARIDDWPGHLARVRAFWGAALLRRGGYSGRPVEAHGAVPGLSGEHMAVWLRLFAVAVRRHCSPAGSAGFLRLAGRMGSRIMGSLGGGR
jgi:hemoglobin